MYHPNWDHKHLGWRGQGGKHRLCVFGQLPLCAVLSGGSAEPVEGHPAGVDARDVLFELLVVAAHLLDGRSAAHVAWHVMPPVRGVRVVHRRATLEELVLRLRPLRLQRRTLVVGGHGTVPVFLGGLCVTM
jgi:hypothetical protein